MPLVCEEVVSRVNKRVRTSVKGGEKKEGKEEGGIHRKKREAENNTKTVL